MYRPGEVVPSSSPYLVRHEHHRSDHEVYALEGLTLPRCRTCGDAVVFIPLDPSVFRSRTQIMSDPDFAPAAAASSGESS